MAWYEIPKVPVQYIADENGLVIKVLLKSADFEELVEKAEDLLDNAAIDRELANPSQNFYSYEEIIEMIKQKKR